MIGLHEVLSKRLFSSLRFTDFTALKESGGIFNLLGVNFNWDQNVWNGSSY